MPLCVADQGRSGEYGIPVGAELWELCYGRLVSFSDAAIGGDGGKVSVVMGQKSHGVTGRLLVYKKEQWFCLGCKQPLEDVPEDTALIRCWNAECEYYQWNLLRPDLASCEVMTKGVSENSPPFASPSVSITLTEAKAALRAESVDASSLTSAVPNTGR